MKDYFVWYINNKEVEREKAYNCTWRQIEQHKLCLAVEHDCSDDEINMVYEIDEREKLENH